MRRTLAVLAILALPLAAWAFVKPVRVLAPELEGVSCEQRICVDDPARRAEAVKLYQDALRSVEASLGALDARPLAVFCSTRPCAEKFGFKGQNAYNFGSYAIVIGDRGWQPYFLRHELIHQVQNRRLGSLRMWLFKPVWFREGMAYSLSGDPRKPLPEPLQGYRSAFETWYRQVGPERLWAEAERL
jgi:hypothetical protein